ncbi:helix-turn-helix domain-containing protein [Georgenia alba]|uniref:Helix-turn-helix domain-containing protein n=1 Tax=Georgenia alba TaxID=2233858 RepID=A0ABW2QDW1_9MICO
MRTSRVVGESPHVAIRAVRCTDQHAGWSEPELSGAAHVVLVRRGRFELHARGRRLTADPTSGYLWPAGQEVRFAHPAGGDVCTSITLSGEEATNGAGAASFSAIRLDARLELAHRMLLRAGDDPDFAAVEAALDVVELAMRRQPDDAPAPGRFELAERAREAIVADEPAASGLIELARHLETAPSHLSRTFRHHVGMSISRYRNRVRVSRALQHLEEGETRLADLAFSLGFSDQAHFTRVMRRELGRSPGRVHGMLAGGSA